MRFLLHMRGGIEPRAVTRLASGTGHPAPSGDAISKWCGACLRTSCAHEVWHASFAASPAGEPARAVLAGARNAPWPGPHQARCQPAAFQASHLPTFFTLCRLCRHTSTPEATRTLSSQLESTPVASSARQAAAAAAPVASSASKVLSSTDPTLLYQGALGAAALLLVGPTLLRALAGGRAGRGELSAARVLDMLTNGEGMLVDIRTQVGVKRERRGARYGVWGVGRVWHGHTSAPRVLDMVTTDGGMPIGTQRGLGCGVLRKRWGIAIRVAAEMRMPLWPPCCTSPNLLSRAPPTFPRPSAPARHLAGNLQAEKEAGGVPDLPSSAGRRATDVEFVSCDDKRLRGMLRDPKV
eukprot:365687-Chlamydomonas_euryale.AAC.15